MSAFIDKNISFQAIGFGFQPEKKIAQLNAFQQEFHKWIHSSVQEVKGLPKKHYIVSGITDAFNQLYGLYNKIGVFEGEYFYHRNVLGDRVTTNFTEADCIVVSHPFSGDGKCSHEKLVEANCYGVPIFVDCAFFGICQGISFDFKKYKNIHSVCFSLSKTFGTGLNRVGMLYTKDCFPVTVYSGEWGYPLVSSAEYHYDLIKTIGPDDMPRRYKDAQTRWCRKLGLIPSPTVIFGLDYSDRYKLFKRGDTNRVCITRNLEL